MSETPLRIETMTAAAVAPYGWMLGKPLSAAPTEAAFGSPTSDFWQEHIFDAGANGEPEVLWVTYRSADPVIVKLEVHHLTQQAVVPLTGSIVQVVAKGTPAGEPDSATLKAFLVPQGEGICMRPGTWHATRTVDTEVTCLMLTRRSTTADLVRHLNQGSVATESRLADITMLRLVR